MHAEYELGRVEDKEIAIAYPNLSGKISFVTTKIEEAG